jgi:hypothetical protein
MAAREDYILKFIALLRQAIAQMIKQREAGRYDEALFVAFNAQEKLFGRKTAGLSKLSLEEMIRLLRLDETTGSGDEKVLGYAALLKETGLVYEAMDRADLAASCFQLALQVMLTVAVTQKPPANETWTTMRELLARIPPEQLHAPVKELLQQMGEINPTLPAT